MLRIMAVAVFALALALPAKAEAQVCTKGKPCGNSCIAVSKTCRVGAGTATKAGSPPATPPTATKAAVSGAAAVSTVGPLTPTMRAVYPFMSHAKGNIYFKTDTSCVLVKGVPDSLRVLVKTELEAKAMGLKRSDERGC